MSVIEFYIEVINKLGKFKSITFTQDKSKYEEFSKVISNVHNETLWEMVTEEGDKFIMSEDLIKESIFILRIVKNNK